MYNVYFRYYEETIRLPVDQDFGYIFANRIQPAKAIDVYPLIFRV